VPKKSVSKNLDLKHLKPKNSPRS